jgi:hypothetical protein
MTRAFAPALLMPLLAAAATVCSPAAAQEGPDEKYNQVIVYGDDPCPESTGDEIIVCARLDEAERYRIPEILRDSDAPENVAWTERVRELETVGAFGTLSCTPTGPGGALGCTQKLIDQAYAEKRTSSDVRFSELIAEERAKRLATIDEEAAETQARVEQAEKEYMERLRREQQGEPAAAVDPSPPPEAIADPDRQPPIEPQVDAQADGDEGDDTPRPVDFTGPAVAD